jgi:hypothetical protein
VPEPNVTDPVQPRKPEAVRKPRLRIRPSTVAMITAIAAIALGVWDSAQNRRHNRLSVAPYLVCDFTMSATPQHTTFAVHLTNEGVGPAVIQTVAITLPESLGGGTYPEWSIVVGLLRQRGIEVVSYWNYDGGEAVGVEGSRELLRAVVARSDQAATVLEQLASIQVVVEYASVYGDRAEARLN